MGNERKSIPVEVPHRMTEAEYEAKSTELLSRIPYQLRGALSYMAYERGHASGLEDMWGNLQDLVWALEDPVKELIKAIENPID